MRRLVLGAVLALASACGSNGASTPTPAPATTASNTVTLHVYNLHLDPKAEPGSDALTFAVHASGSLHVAVRGPDVDICPVGTQAPCEHRKVADVDAGGATVRATGEAVDIDEIAVTYEPSDRSVHLVLPLVAPRPGESVCKDSCNPVFEMTPFRAGRFTATVTWDGIGTGRVLVETGGVAEHAYTELGKPYRELTSETASSDKGKPTLTITTTIPAAEAALALENVGARPLLTPTIDATWP